MGGQTHCSYEVPEIAQIDVIEGNPLYLAWVSEEVINIPSK